MSEPLYSVGRYVAVSAMTPNLIVIPSTVVRARKFIRKGEIRRAGALRFRQSHDKWAYRVDGIDGWVDERCLRPINPDTGYLSTPSSTETPNERNNKENVND